MFPLPVNSQLSYSNVCWSPLLTDYNVQIFQSLSCCQGWIGADRGLVSSVCEQAQELIALGTALFLWTDKGKLRKLTWRWVILLYLTCECNHNYLMRDYIQCFKKNRHLRWYGMDFLKEKNESRGWLASHFNCTGILSLVDSRLDVDSMQTVLDVLALWFVQSQKLLHSLMGMALPIWVEWLNCNKWDISSTEHAIRVILAGHLLQFAAGICQQWGENFPLMQVKMVWVVCFSSTVSASKCDLMRTPQISSSKA